MEMPLREKRSFTAFFFFSLLTLGIYSIVQMYHITQEINLIASPRDGKHTMNYLLMIFVLSWLTLGIAPLIWYHRISNRIGEELISMGSHREFGSEDFWLWYIVGSVIYIGPCVYTYKLLHSMNEINAHYNQQGRM